MVERVSLIGFIIYVSVFSVKYMLCKLWVKLIDVWIFRLVVCVVCFLVMGLLCDGIVFIIMV